MAPRASLPLVMAVAVALTPAVHGQAPPCADLSGTYAQDQNAEEWDLSQSGCSLIGSARLTGDVVAGTVSGNVATINVTGFGFDRLTGTFQPASKQIYLDDGTILTRIGGCSEFFAGYWVDGSNGSLAISIDPTGCSGTMMKYPNTYSIAVTMSGNVMTYKPSTTAVTNVKAVLKLPATLTLADGSVWTLRSPIPCFRTADFRLSYSCWMDIQGLQRSGVIDTISKVADSKGAPLWSFRAGDCNYVGPQSPAECPKGCYWLDSCICPDVATCVASSGSSWQSRALTRGVCTGDIPAKLAQPTADCCGGLPNYCQPITSATPPSPPPPPPSTSTSLPPSTSTSLPPSSSTSLPPPPTSTSLPPPATSSPPAPSPASSTTTPGPKPPTPGPSYYPPAPTPSYYPPAPGPSYYPPAPGPAYKPPTASCGKLPSAVIRNLEQASGLAVRRCGSSPSPAYAPSPGYQPPTPPPPPPYYYAPSPIYGTPTTPPPSPSPSPSYPKAGPSPSLR